MVLQPEPNPSRSEIHVHHLVYAALVPLHQPVHLALTADEVELILTLLGAGAVG